MATVIDKKKVNVRAHSPIVGLKHPIAGVVKGITLTIEDILICIRSGAKVEEVLPYKIVPLDFTNYDKDNSIKEAEVATVAAKVMNVTAVDGKLVVEEPAKQTAVPPVVKTETIKPEPVVEKTVVKETAAAKTPDVTVKK